MSAYDARQTIAIGDGQGRITKLRCPQDQFIWMRSTTQKGVIRETVQFGKAHIPGAGLRVNRRESRILGRPKFRKRLFGHACLASKESFPGIAETTECYVRNRCHPPNALNRYRLRRRGVQGRAQQELRPPEF